MIAFRGAALVLPDRLIDTGTLIVDTATIADVLERDAGADQSHDRPGCVIVPGFVDVHVHGVEGLDTLDAGAPIARIASRLPRYGVTAFCPTTVACSPSALDAVLGAVGKAGLAPPAGARVLRAHLESNFINPEYRGAQPLSCLRLPPVADRSCPRFST